MSNNSIADIIRDQIGHKALFMMGAKNLINTGKGLRFKFANCSKFNHVEITLTSLDLYTVKFYKMRNLSIVNIQTHESIYFDMLHQLIESETGLYLNL